MPAIPARRAQRSEKLREFQVKKPTGRIAPSSSREPSTRQYVIPLDSAAGKAQFELDRGCAIAGGRLVANAPMPRKLHKMAMSHKNDVSHLLVKPLWNGFSARVLVHTTVWPRLEPGASCLGNCKSSILGCFSQDGAPGLRHRRPQAPGFPQSATGSAARSRIDDNEMAGSRV